MEVCRPNGELIRLKTEGLTPAAAEGKKPPAADKTRRGQVFRYADTHEPGVYAVRSLDDSRPLDTAFAVNLDPLESDPEVLPHEELQKRLAGRRVVRRRGLRPGGHAGQAPRGDEPVGLLPVGGAHCAGVGNVHIEPFESAAGRLSPLPASSMLEGTPSGG